VKGSGKKRTHGVFSGKKDDKVGGARAFCGSKKEWCWKGKIPAKVPWKK